MEPTQIKFIFIGGCGRSGTTLVQKLLILHSKITGNGEFDFLAPLMHVFDQMSNPEHLKRQSFFYNKEQLGDIWKKHIEALLTSNIDVSKFEYLSEKTPNNIYCAEQLLELIPGSKFIYVYRDGRDVISSFKQVKKRAKSKGEQLPNSIKDWASMWNNTSQKYHQLKNNDKFNGRHIAIKYEDLVNSPEESIANLMIFLGLQVEKAQLHPETEKGSFELKSDDVWYTHKMHNQEINAGNIAKWKNDLNMIQKIVYQTIMAPRLCEYSYPISTFYIRLNTFLKKSTFRSLSK